jgi:GMP synthase (glutamine-hydrolysing)
MILILDCTNQHHPLLREEFVHPVQILVEGAGYETHVIPLDTRTLPAETKAVILTGTALMDNRFLKIGLPDPLKIWDGPVLGICAGMQLLVLSHGGSLIPCEKIGMTEIAVIKDDPVFSGKDRFVAWELHRSGVEGTGDFEVIARSASGVQGIKLLNKPWYGMLFHPEVRNEWLLINFLKSCVCDKTHHLN